MRTETVRGLLIRTELGDTYFCPESVGKEPAAAVSRISEGLRANAFIACVDMYGRKHFVSTMHIVEIFVGEHPARVENEDKEE